MKDNGPIARPFQFPPPLVLLAVVVVVELLPFSLCFIPPSVLLGENRNSLGQFYDSFHGQQFAASIDGALYCIKNIIMIGRLGFIDRKIRCSGIPARFFFILFFFRRFVLLLVPLLLPDETN